MKGLFRTGGKHHRSHAAFMGWGPRDRLGKKFAHTIAPGDIILIARRHNYKPEIVGFGVVRGKYRRAIKGVKTPQKFGSMRNLSPFIAISETPKRIPLIDALHTFALMKLHPEYEPAHALVCKWMERLLTREGKRILDKRPPIKSNAEQEVPRDARIATPRKNPQLDYIVRSKRQVKKARKQETELLEHYRLWLKRQGRTLEPIRGKLECDGFEKKRHNLIEAKSSAKREYIRMAVGQLLDYSFEFEKFSKFGKFNMGILLPRQPDANSVEWLKRWKIYLVWREKKGFLDNANGNFA